MRLITKLVIAVIAILLLNTYLGGPITGYLVSATTTMSLEQKILYFAQILVSTIIVVTVLLALTISGARGKPTETGEERQPSRIRMWLVRMLTGERLPPGTEPIRYAEHLPITDDTPPPELLDKDAIQCEKCGHNFIDRDRPNDKAWKIYRLKAIAPLAGVVRYSCPKCQTVYRKEKYQEPEKKMDDKPSTKKGT